MFERSSTFTRFLSPVLGNELSSRGDKLWPPDGSAQHEYGNIPHAPSRNVRLKPDATYG